jgi:hypothetical protein
MSDELVHLKKSDGPESLLPVLVKDYRSLMLGHACEEEAALLSEARNLFQDRYYDHALLDLWNASVLNLRRRVESYGIDLFMSVAKDEPGRRKYDPDGDSIQDRWAGVDDHVLVQVATKLGLLNKKAGKALEMIGWMRSHRSAAHGSDDKVGAEDVVAFGLLLQTNLFQQPFPEPGHSVGSLFDPVKADALNDDNIEMLIDQIRTMRPQDIKVAFGFMLDLLCKGEPPAFDNVKRLFPAVWERASDDLRKTAGLRYHTYMVNKKADDSADGNARLRVLEFLIQVQGVKYIPDSARAVVYRHAAKSLAKAKDTAYGFSAEVSAAKTLAQLGSSVPSLAFDEVYQEILAVWCGNYWRRSAAFAVLQPFVDALGTEQIRTIARMFMSNERVRSELFQDKPQQQAIHLLEGLRTRLTIEAHRAEVDEAIESVKAL